MPKSTASSAETCLPGKPTDEELATLYVTHDDAGDYDLASRHEAEFFRRRRANREDEDDATHAWCKLIDLVDAKLREVKP